MRRAATLRNPLGTSPAAVSGVLALHFRAANAAAAVDELVGSIHSTQQFGYPQPLSSTIPLKSSVMNQGLLAPLFDQRDIEVRSFHGSGN